MNSYIHKMIATTFLTLLLTGCSDGPAENAGEKLDNAYEEAKDAIDDACEDVSGEHC